MNDFAYTIVRNLLEIGAIKFNFEEPFTWTSGWKSPVYCDNRMSLSYTELRGLVRDAYVKIIQDKFPDVEVIAAVATGGIPQGALVADKLGLPLTYIRDKRKDCGLSKVVEGNFKKGQKIVILEDHISTGGSCLRAFEELKKENVDVLGIVAAFSYGFPMEVEKVTRLEVISTFAVIQEIALKEGYITEAENIKLNKWHKNPMDYGKEQVR